MVTDSIDEATDRFVDIAFEENPNIQDFGEFKDALLSSFNTPRGKNATGQFSDDTLKHFFESNEFKRKIKGNITQEEYDRIYGQFDRGEIEVLKIKEGDLRVIQTSKQLKVTPHSRKGRRIKSYNRGFQKWSNAEAKFLEVRRKRKLTPNQIINEFNQHFKQNPRSSSSIKTKLYRI